MLYVISNVIIKSSWTVTVLVWIEIGGSGVAFENIALYTINEKH